MVSDLKTFTNKGFKITAKKVCFWANFARIRRLYNKDQEVIQQGSGGYTTRIRRLYNKDQEVISKIFLVSVLLSASVERCFDSRVRDFYLEYLELAWEGSAQPLKSVSITWYRTLWRYFWLQLFSPAYLLPHLLWSRSC